MSSIEFQLPKYQNSIIKVIGVGGGGSNAVNNMYLKGIKGVDFVVCNTDMQALEMSPVPNRIRLGALKTEGLGAGANPSVGRISAMESLEEIREILKSGTKMVFVTAGMGGGTGTGGAPVIAQLAREMGILTVGIVTTPFRFEGKRRYQQALEGIAELQQAVDTIVVINNDNLTRIFGNTVTMKRAFEEADQVLCNAARGIAEIITLEGYINVDFADVQTIMKDGGTALMGTANCTGEDRALRAAEEAISSPLLDNVNIHGSRGILLNITASADSLRLDETTTIVEYIQEAAGDNADIIFGTVYDESMGENLSVTVIATGFSSIEADLQASRQTLMQSEPMKETPQVKEVKSDDFTISLSGSFDLSADDIVQPSLFGKESKEPEIKSQSNDAVLEERMRKLKSSDYDFHNPSKLNNLESEPAYLRKKVSLEEEEPKNDLTLSNLSLEEISDNRFFLSDNNSFLHDQVD
jgi:cell division protein FtsZ